VGRKERKLTRKCQYTGKKFKPTFFRNNYKAVLGGKFWSLESGQGGKQTWNAFSPTSKPTSLDALRIWKLKKIVNCEQILGEM